MPIVYLNGRFLPDTDAFVPVLDRGFIFGDGVYEVIPAYHRRPFRLDEHLLRLDDSLAAVRIEPPLRHDDWAGLLDELIRRNAGDNQSLYLQITRGVAKRDHAMPPGIKPTIFAMSNPLLPLPQTILDHGVAAITLEDNRWRDCHIKAIALLPNILLRQQALDAGAAEAILIRNGIATEGAASNLFIVLDGALITPPKCPNLLPGITRDLILELAALHGIAHREADISAAELARAEEVWITSSTREIVPVTRLDNCAVGDGTPGAVWRQMYQHFQNYKAALRQTA